jgi:hypothetical protein
LAIHLELRERTRRNSDDTTDEITAADDGGWKWTRHNAFQLACTTRIFCGDFPACL